MGELEYSLETCTIAHQRIVIYAVYSSWQRSLVHSIVDPIPGHTWCTRLYSGFDKPYKLPLCRPGEITATGLMQILTLEYGTVVRVSLDTDVYGYPIGRCTVEN